MLCSYCEAFGFCDEHRGFPKIFRFLQNMGIQKMMLYDNFCERVV